MKRYSLKFANNKLENDYQQKKQKALQIPIFRTLVFMTSMLNIVKITQDFVYRGALESSWINIIFQSAVFLIMIIVYKRPKFIKIAIIFGNLATSFLQFNFKNGSTLQEYYSYGSNFTLLQAVVYFSTDFTDCLIQVPIHLTTKIFITTWYSDRFDYTGSAFGVVISLFLLYIIYTIDKGTRIQFLLNQQDIKWEKSLSIILQKPYYQFNYNEELNRFQTISQFNQQRFPYYNDEMCDGCNFRNFIRSCKYNTLNIEDELFNKIKEQNYQLNITLQQSCIMRDYSIIFRIFNVGVEKINCILVLDQVINRQQTKILQTSASKSIIIESLKPISKLQQQKHYILGIMSILYLNDKTIIKLNLLHLLKKITNKFESFIQRKIKIIRNDKQNFYMVTYKSQLMIFLIQLFNYLIVKQQSSYGYVLFLEQNNESINLTIPVDKNFIEEFTTNYFVLQTSPLLLISELDSNKIYFNRNVIKKNIQIFRSTFSNDIIII